MTGEEIELNVELEGYQRGYLRIIPEISDGQTIFVLIAPENFKGDESVSFSAEELDKFNQQKIQMLESLSKLTADEARELTIRQTTQGPLRAKVLILSVWLWEEGAAAAERAPHLWLRVKCALLPFAFEVLSAGEFEALRKGAGEVNAEDAVMVSPARNSL